MFENLPLVAYIGPETILPFASFLAAIGGIVLICWRYVVASCKKVVRFVLRRPS